MRITVGFKNPKTGEIKRVKVGWSWTLLLFSGVFGIPLFMRRLSTWGAVFLGIALAWLIIPAMMLNNPSAGAVMTLLSVLSWSMYIWIAVKGNEMTAKNYLRLGWTFSDPDSDATRFGKLKWGLVA